MCDNWKCLLFFLVLVFSFILIFVYKHIKKQQSITFLWLLYFIIFFICYFLSVVLMLNFCYGKLLLYFLFKQYNIQTVLRDPQEILDILFSFGFWVSLFVFLICCWFYLNLYVSNIFRKEEFRVYSFIQLIMLYFVSLSFLLFVWDLLAFHTDVFSQQNHFKFEPDVLKWYRYYESEYVDLLLSLVLVLCFFLLILNNKYIRIVINLSGLRFLPFGILLIFYFYFFGGESFARDFGILLSSFGISEILNFTAMFFSFLKRYK